MNGRAVQIGVFSGNTETIQNLSCPVYVNDTAHYVHVSDFVDWILYVTNDLDDDYIVGN